MPQLPHGTVTLLFSDVEESTRLVQTLGARYGAALAAHRRLMREAFAAHRGVEVDTQGDSFLYAFARAHEAIHAAADAQRALAAQQWPGGEPLKARMGIHTGEPELTAGGYYVGLDLSRGARICEAAHGGQVLLSQTTRDVVADDVPARDLGDYVLKGLAGRERLFQLVAPGIRFDFPPLRAQRLGNLPSPRTRLVGRRAEVERILSLLSESPVITLTGPGGIGKTRLALEVAREAAGWFEDGAYFVGLAAVDDAAAVASVIAQRLEVAEGPGESAAAAIRRAFSARSALIVLDSFERVVPSAPLVSDLVETCSGVKVLATSRERLHVAAEIEYAVPSLDEGEAVTLFRARAAAARPTLEPRAGDDQIVRAICRRLDGLPLAIELAAARIRLLPLTAILQRLEQRLSFLTGGAHDLPARMQTLAATIDWSYALLTPDEQAALKRLSVFAAGFSLQAAAALLGDEEVALRLLSSLRDKSLVVTRTATDGGARFGMLDTIREYAFARLHDEEGDAEAQERHAAYFTELSETADRELRGPQQATWLGRLDDDHQNLRAALGWVRDAGSPETFLSFTGALWRFWFIRAHASEGRTWIEDALRQYQGPRDATLARGLFGASTLALADGDLEAARGFAAERLLVCRTLGEDAEIASALGALANTAAALGDYDDARRVYGEAAEHAGRAGAWAELASTMNNLGYLSLLTGDAERAIAQCGEARRRFVELGFHEDVAGAGVNVAMALLHESRADDAAPIVAESLSAYAELGHNDGVSYCLDAVAAAGVQRRGNPRRCAILTGAAEILRDRTCTAPPPLERALHRQTLRELEDELEPEELESALAEGKALTLERAVAIAFELIDPSRIPAV